MALDRRRSNRSPSSGGARRSAPPPDGFASGGDRPDDDDGGDDRGNGGDVGSGRSRRRPVVVPSDKRPPPPTTTATVTTANTNASSSEESSARRVFESLDPILRTILASVSALREALDAGKSDDDDDDGKEEKVLSILRTQAKLLDALRTTIEWVVVADGHDDDFGRREGLVVMADYILLPLCLFLQSRPEEEEEEGRRGGSGARSSTTERRSRRHLVRRSAELSRTERAARALELFARTVGGGGGGGRGDDDDDDGDGDGIGGRGRGRRPSSRLKSETIVRCLISCAKALPDEDDDEEEEGRDVRDDKEGALDSGEGRDLAVLSCASSLLSLSAADGRRSDDDDGATTSEAISDAMGGALTARLAQGCLSALLPSPPPSLPPRLGGGSGGEGPTGGRGRRDGGGGGGRGNVPLKLQALDTLRRLMEGAPSKKTWRSLFPGCFAGLFRAASSNLRLSPAASSSKVVAESILVLAELLGLALSDDGSGDAGGGEGGGGGDAEARNGTPPPTAPPSGTSDSPPFAAARSLTEAVDLANRTHAEERRRRGRSSSSTDGPPPPPASSSSPPPPGFLGEINSRLPGPLTMLFGLIPASGSSPKVRIAGTALCRSVLEDAVRRSWNEDVEERLGRSAVECCLVLRDDPDADVAAAAARSVLSSYRTSLGPNGWEQHVRTDLAPRVLDLIEGLPASATSGRRVELKRDLDLVRGYLTLEIDEEPTMARGAGTGRRRRKGKKKKEVARGDDNDSGGGGTVGASLSCEGPSERIRSAFGVLFEVDVDSVGSPSRIDPLAVVDVRRGSSPSTTTTNRSFEPTSAVVRFRHLRDDRLVESAFATVRTFGEAIGPKRGSTFADDCVADVVESCVEGREERSGGGGTGASFRWRVRVDRVRRWSGLIVAANEVLIGSFRRGEDAADARASGRKRKRRRNLLRSLATAVLPVLLGGPLWDLPTSRDDVEEEDATALLDRDGPRDADGRRQRRLEEGPSARSVASPETTVPTSALNGNAALLCRLIELVRTVFDLLADASDDDDENDRLGPFLTVALGPLLEKAGSKVVHPAVRRSAVEALGGLAHATGAGGSVRDLVANDFDRLAGRLLDDMRRRSNRRRDFVGRSTFPASTTGVVELLLRCLAAADSGGGGTGPSPPPAAVAIRASRASLVVDLVDALTASFDASQRRHGRAPPRRPPPRQRLLRSEEDVDDASPEASERRRRRMDCLGLVAVYESSVELLRATTAGATNVDRANVSTEPSLTTEEEESSWLSLLDEFRIESGSPSDVSPPHVVERDELEEALASPMARDGFASYHAAKAAKGAARSDGGNPQGDDAESPVIVSNDSSSMADDNEEIVVAPFLNRIVSRCCHLLSYPDLHVRVGACQTLDAAFRCLASTTRDRHGATSDEKRSNPLLPSISEFWPSVAARLRAASSEFLRDRGLLRPSGPSLLLATTSQPSIRRQGGGDFDDERAEFGADAFLSELLSLSATLCELSGEFMVDRFRNDVWPVLSNLLGTHVQGSSRHSTASSSAADGRRTDPDRGVLPSVLRCLSRTFSSAECGLGVSELIPVAGALLLPLLETDDDVVGAIVLKTFECLLSIDGDGLWRPLSVAAGAPFPPRRLGRCLRRGLTPSEAATSSSSSTTELAERKPPSLLEVRAKALMEFADDLPERALRR